jgi:aspartyl-tRNA synthetase
MLRSHNCGELSLKDLDLNVKLSGWITHKREFGPILFIIVSDRYGITQVVINDPELVEKCKKLSVEDVVAVSGKVIDRKENRTDKYSTGEIEVEAEAVTLLNSSKPMPYDHKKDASDTIKLKYRYLDIRKSNIREILASRSKISGSVRNFLDKNGFLDIETPVLNKSTPEGARDFLVPSRLSKGSFYALPQSPQIFKQLLMIAGMDRYYQIVKCFRDEDFRSDRQPEFTQIDIEMSFADESDIMDIAENMIKEVIKNILPDCSLPEKFPLMSYNEAMERFGTDAPDTRYGMELITLDNIFKDSSFNAFANAAQNSKMAVKGVLVQNKADVFSRNVIKKMETAVQGDGAKGLAFIKKINGTLESPLLKFFSEKETAGLSELISENGVLFIVADSRQVALKSMGNFRKRMAQELKLIEKNVIAPLWVVDFPAFEFNEENERWVATHHPFTDFDMESVEKGAELSQISSRAYDMVINGHEVGGGSIRIHNIEKQKKVFSILGISEKEAEEKFGFLLEALQFGAPPHCGIAFGLDRLVMVILGIEAIRDVIAFPKTTSATCLMSCAPSNVATDQLEELGIKIIEKKDDNN